MTKITNAVGTLRRAQRAFLAYFGFGVRKIESSISQKTAPELESLTEPKEDSKRERKFDWGTACGVMSFPLAIGGMGDMPLPFRILCFALCAVCGSFYFMNHERWSKRIRIGLTFGISIVMLAIIIFAARKSLDDERDPLEKKIVAQLSERENSKTAVELECQQDRLPITIQPKSVAHIMFMNRKARTDGGLFDIPGGTASYLWPSSKQMIYPKGKPNYGINIYRCELSNEGNTKLFNVALTFRLNYFQTPIGPSSKQEFPYQVVANPLPPNDRFTFYLVNECPIAASAIAPETFSTAILGVEGRSTFNLLRPHRNIVEQFMLLPPSTVSWTGEACD